MHEKLKKNLLRGLPKRIRKLAEKKKVIGMGRNRLVVDLENGYVLKIAKDSRGFAHNQREITTYQTCAYPAKRYLAKIVDHGEGWLIMMRHSREFPHSLLYKRRLLRVARRFREAGINPIDLFDTYRQVKAKNLRLRHSGRIVVIDYGAFKSLQDQQNIRVFRRSGKVYEPSSESSSSSS